MDKVPTDSFEVWLREEIRIMTGRSQAYSAEAARMTTRLLALEDVLKEFEKAKQDAKD